MLRPLFALVTLVILCAVIGMNTLAIKNVQTRQATAPQTIVLQAPAPAAAPAPAQERIIDLPEDGDVWYTSLFVHADYQKHPSDRRLVAAFDTDPRLVSLRSQTKYHIYTSDSAVFQERFATAVTKLPCLLVQTSDGTTVYKASGDRVAARPEALATEIGQTINKRCPNGRCNPQPPAPPAQPVAPVQPPPQLPVLDTPPPPPAKHESVILLGALFAAVFVAVIGLKIKGEASAGGS